MVDAERAVAGELIDRRFAAVADAADHIGAEALRDAVGHLLPGVHVQA